MKIPVWCLMLACLFSPGRGDCQGECFACGLLLQQQQMHQAFNTLVCLLECEGQVTSSLTFEVCKGASPVPEGGALPKRSAEEARTTSDGERPEPRRLSPDWSAPESSEEGLQELRLAEEPGEAEGDHQPEDDRDQSPVALIKRFGGFQRGRHGYRKLMGPPGRPLQKRYGGFIGVRKSARKWNSQKRVNQLLRQYLGMRSSRSGRFGAGAAARIWRQNRL